MTQTDLIALPGPVKTTYAYQVRTAVRGISTVVVVVVVVVDGVRTKSSRSRPTSCQCDRLARNSSQCGHAGEVLQW